MWQLRTLLLGVVVFCVSTEAHYESTTDKECADAANCILVGRFSEINEIRIGGHDTIPMSSSVGRFKVSKRIKANTPGCVAPIEIIDVIFPTGRLTLPPGTGIGMGNDTLAPQVGKPYTIFLVPRGVLIPAACSTWFKEHP